MTTFGGNTIPPIFAGGASAPVVGNIFLRSTGDFYNSNVDGQAQQNIPLAPTINVDDDLYVLSFGTPTDPVNIGDWTAIFTTPLLSRFRLYRRRADGTAADNFTMAAHTLSVVAKMACFGNISQPTVSELAPFQGGFVNSDTDATWTVDGMTANTTRDPTACAMLFAARSGITGIVGPTVDSSLLPTIIGQIAIGGVSGDATLWFSWEFDNQIPSIAYVNFLELDYSPDPTSALQWTQYERLGLF